MNSAYSKLEVLEQDFKRKEAMFKKETCYMTYIDTDLQERVNYLLEKIRHSLLPSDKLFERSFTRQDDTNQLILPVGYFMKCFVEHIVET